MRPLRRCAYGAWGDRCKVEAHGRDFWTDDLIMRGTCSQRCAKWADWESADSDGIPFWASRHCFMQTDRYALVTAMARGYGKKTVVHLRMGYNLRMCQRMAKILPFKELLGDGETKNLDEFFRANREFPCCFDVWTMADAWRVLKIRREVAEVFANAHVSAEPEEPSKRG